MDKQDIQSWNGEGLPPVGTVCEINLSNYSGGSNWHKVTINYASSSNIVAMFSNGFEAVELGPVNSPELPDGWIKCSERMPEENTQVLASAYGEVSIGVLINGVFHHDYCGEVSHWQPIPAPPTTEK